MMTERQLVLTLTEEEYTALKKGLGKHSSLSWENHGLTREQGEICSKLYSRIPYHEDEE